MSRNTLLLFFFLTIGCGYSDHDKVEKRSEIIENISLQKWESDKLSHLVFRDRTVIVEDCLRVVYDSVSKTIYAETYQTSKDRSYWQINVLNPFASSVSEATLKKEISEVSFDRMTKSIKNKWEFSK